MLILPEFCLKPPRAHRITHTCLHRDSPLTQLDGLGYHYRLIAPVAAADGLQHVASSGGPELCDPVVSAVQITPSTQVGGRHHPACMCFDRGLLTRRFWRHRWQSLLRSQQALPDTATPHAQYHLYCHATAPVPRPTAPSNMAQWMLYVAPADGNWTPAWFGGVVAVVVVMSVVVAGLLFALLISRWATGWGA